MVVVFPLERDFREITQEMHFERVFLRHYLHCRKRGFTRERFPIG